MSRVLVTGGTGFFGSHLVARLLTLGHAVAYTTRYLDTRRLPARVAGAEPLEVDIRDRDRVKTSIGAWKPDALFHLAAFHHVGLSFTHVEECFDVNAKGTANVLDAAPDAWRLYVSSSEVYGLDIPEPWSESMPPNPRSPYAVTKYAGELYARTLRGVGIVRPFNLYGPGQSERAVIGRLTRLALAHQPIRTTPGQQRREFNYVTDVAWVLTELLAQQWAGGPLNICRGLSVSIHDLLTMILTATRSMSAVDESEPYRPNEIWNMRGDPSQVDTMFPDRPRTPFHRGLIATLEAP